MRRLTQLLAAVALTFGAALASAHDFAAGDIRVDHPWARPSVTMRTPGAAYFSLTNTGAEADRLIAARPVGFAERAELHTHINDNGVMRMREVEGGVEIPAGETGEFRPGGLHVMLYGLAAPLAEGELHPLVLVFEHAGEVEVGVVVENRAPGGHAGAHQH